MPPLRELPELVQDAELQVTIRDNITIHTEPLECRDDFSPQTWETKRTIGRGGDGTVFLQHKIEGPGAVDMIAVKQMSLNTDLASDDHDSKRYVRELEALAKFAQGRYSRYFVRSYGWYKEEGWLYICMEYCKHLDLGKHLKAYGPLSEESARAITSQILQGLVQMHKNKIAHRDLKPANILIHRKRPEDATWWVVLGDLGLSRRSGASSGSTTIRGTPSFMAPETIGKPFLGNPNNADPFSADMWCLGETISCTLTGHGTFSNNEQLLRYQHRRRFPDSALKASGVSSDAIEFIRSLMDVDPLRRPTALQALDHPWIKTNNISHTRTSSAITISTVDNSEGDASRASKGSESQLFGLEDQTTSSADQTTQASALWTQTLPMRSIDTQASQNSNENLVSTANEATNPASLVKPTGPESNLNPTIIHTKSTPALSQPQSLMPSEEATKNLGGDNQGLKIEPGLLTSKWAKDELLRSFKQFSAAEKQRLLERQRAIEFENRRISLEDLKRFSTSFQMKTSVPLDLIPILSNDEEKQAQIVQRQELIKNNMEREATLRAIEARMAAQKAREQAWKAEKAQKAMEEAWEAEQAQKAEEQALGAEAFERAKEGFLKMIEDRERSNPNKKKKKRRSKRTSTTAGGSS